MRSIHALSVAVGLVAAPFASAAYLGVSIVEITGTLPPAPNLPANLRTFRLFAVFDGPGEAVGPNRVNTVLSVGQTDSSGRLGLSELVPATGQFFQADPSDGAQPGKFAAPDVSAGNPRALYDTFATIGRAAQDPGAGVVDTTATDPDFALLNGNLLAGDPSVGLGDGHDRFAGGWYNSVPQNQQGAAVFNPERNRHETLLAQFSATDIPANLFVGPELSHLGSYESEVLVGYVSIFTQRAGGGADSHFEIFNYRIGGRLQPPVPAPGALSLLALAALSARRRR